MYVNVFYFQASCQPIDWKVFYDKEFYFVLKTNQKIIILKLQKASQKAYYDMLVWYCYLLGLMFS